MGQYDASWYRWQEVDVPGFITAQIGKQMNRTALLSAGIFTIPMAARLLDMPQQNLRGWVRGYSGTACDPLIPSEFKAISNRIALSFVNLIEARFIAAFASQGVSVRAIRYMVNEAKRVLSHPHPFATEMIFRTDGRTIFMQAADATGDQALYDLRGRNFAIADVLKQEFKKSVIYGGSGIAEAWYPRKEVAPDVLVNPKVCFGQPAMADSGIPTEAIFDAFIAEERNYSGVARWFDIHVDRVKEAVDFELALKTIH